VWLGDGQADCSGLRGKQAPSTLSSGRPSIDPFLGRGLSWHYGPRWQPKH
jgi:hypothetical protein